MININTDKGKSLLEKCNVLNDYEYFVEKVRDLKKKYKELSLQDILTLSITECRKEERLSTYLARKNTEVLNMIFGEYDYDTDIKVQRREAFEDGERRGLQKGQQIATQNIAKQFLAFGLDIQLVSKCTGLSIEEIESMK